jgi:hypothetical protein
MAITSRHLVYWRSSFLSFVIFQNEYHSELYELNYFYLGYLVLVLPMSGFLGYFVYLALFGFLVILSCRLVSSVYLPFGFPRLFCLFGVLWLFCLFGVYLAFFGYLVLVLPLSGFFGYLVLPLSGSLVILSIWVLGYFVLPLSGFLGYFGFRQF